MKQILKDCRRLTVFHTHTRDVCFSLDDFNFIIGLSSTVKLYVRLKNDSIYSLSTTPNTKRLGEDEINKIDNKISNNINVELMKKNKLQQEQFFEKMRNDEKFENEFTIFKCKKLFWELNLHFGG